MKEITIKKDIVFVLFSKQYIKEMIEKGLVVENQDTFTFKLSN